MYKKLLLSYIIFNLHSPVFASQEQEILSPDVQALLHTEILNPVQPHLVFNSKQNADAWAYDMSNRLKKWVIDKDTRIRYLTIIQYEAVRAGLDPQIVLSLITVESRFNPYAISPVGALGIMQIMPFWQKQIGTSSQSLLDVRTNIRYGCTILRYYLDKEKGNMDRALARYNGSLGKTWYPDLVHDSYNKYWTPYPVMMMVDGKPVMIDYTKD